MYRKFLKGFTAISMAAMIMTAQAVTVFAAEYEDKEVTVDQSGTYNSVTVTGEGQVAVDAGNGDNIHINEDVMASGAAAVGVKAVDNAKVYVDGDVTSTGSGSAGIKAFDSSEVNVRGSVNADAENSAYSTAPDVEIYDNASVATSYGGGVFNRIDVNITPNNDDAAGRFISFDRVNKIDVLLGDQNYSDVADVVNDVPEIYVHTLFNEISAYSTVKDTAFTDEVASQIMDKVNYFIRSSVPFDSSYENAESHSVSIDGVSGNAQAVKYNEVFYITPIMGEGSRLGVSEAVKFLGESNGTYKYQLISREGGIMFYEIRPTSYNNDGTVKDYVVEKAVEVVPETPSENNTAETVADTSSMITVVENTSSYVAAISGDKPARTVSVNVSTVTPRQYVEAVVNNVASAPVGGAFNLETDSVSCFDRNMIEAIASRPDIDVNVVFSFNGYKYKVTIPAGYDVRTLLDSTGYCGFLRLMSILGGARMK